MSKETTNNTDVSMNIDEIQLYELGFHIIPSISEEKVSEVVNTVKKVLTTNAAEIIKEESPSLIDLAYTMEKKIGETSHKFDKAYFGWIKFNSTSGHADNVKSTIESDKNILRSLLVKIVDDEAHSTAKIKSGEESEDKSEEENGKKPEVANEKTLKNNEKKVAKKSTDSEIDEAIDKIV